MTSEHDLDPEDWSSFRALAHRMVDDMLDSLETLRDRPVWQPLPDEVKHALREPLPRQGAGEEETYRAFRERILPYTNGNRHPRFFGWVQGNGTPLAMMADMLAAGMNPHCGGFEQSSTYVELQVLEWLRELMGFPEGSSGLLVSGGTMANFVGLAAARDAASEGDGELVVYGSSEMHGWGAKSAHLLGLDEGYRLIPVDERFRIRVDELPSAIASDRAAGRRPFCVMGSAGTINSGAVDDLEALADLCAEEGLWFHVDGAYGAWARLSATHADEVRGMERADSLAFDLHKWGYLPFEVACVLVRDAEAHERPFTITGSYLDRIERGVAAAGLPFAKRGLELTRGFKALKVWMTLKAYGVDRLAALVDRNLAQAQRLAELFEADPLVELTAPVQLNVVCFRLAVPDRTAEELDALNLEWLVRIQESGLAVPSSTRLDGRVTLRAAFTNHRTSSADVELLAETAGAIGRELVSG